MDNSIGTVLKKKTIKMSSSPSREPEEVQLELQPSGDGTTTHAKQPRTPFSITDFLGNIQMADVEGCCPDLKDNNNKMIAICIGVLFIIGLMLLIIILPLSFSYLDYYEYGVVRNKITASVNLDKVYDSGRYVIGPSHEFKTFQADAHFQSVNNIRVFTSDKLEVGLSAWYQYFLVQNELPYLHKKYDIYYHDKVKRKGNDAIKNVVTRFTTRDVVKQRLLLETELYQNLKKILGGDCCEAYCERDQNATGCESCKPRNNCTVENYGMFVDVRYFQLGAIDIPDALDESFLNALILNASAEREGYLQAAHIVRKETEQKVKQIENLAAETLQAAQSDSRVISDTAKANASFMVENARITGLKNLYNTLNLDRMEDRNKFDYLRSLQQVNDLHLTIGYETMISGGLPKK